MNMRAETVAIVEQRGEQHEGERPEDLHRHAEELAGEHLASRRVHQLSSAIDLPCVMIMMKPRSMKFMPSVAISEDRLA